MRLVRLPAFYLFVRQASLFKNVIKNQKRERERKPAYPRDAGTHVSAVKAVNKFLNF